MMMLAVSGNGIAQSPQSTAAPEPLSLTISAVQDRVVAGSPVIVKTIVTNKLNQDFSMWVEIGDMYRVDVRDTKGGVPPETKYVFYHDNRINVGRVMGNSDVDLRALNGSRLYVTYKANVSLTGSANISDMYNFAEPGTYIITLSLANFPTVKSNPVTVTVIPALAATSAQATEQKPASAPFSLDVSVDDTAIKPGLPVDVLVVTKNVSTHSIVLRRQEHPQDTGMLGSAFRVDAWDSQGNPPPDTQLGQSTGNRAETPPDPISMASARAAGTLVSLKPGEDWRNTLRVSDLYDLSKPGQYTIQVRRWDYETRTWVKSNTVMVTVTP
jgi:hypothetical protein